MTKYSHHAFPDDGRRAFPVGTPGTVAATILRPGSAGAAESVDPEKSMFMEEATRLAIESVEKGGGGPFGAVIVKDGEIIGRGQNRVLLSGCPVHHAEITAIMNASENLNQKARPDGECDACTTLQMIPSAPGAP
jgi:guanine deaminase